MTLGSLTGTENNRIPWCLYMWCHVYVEEKHSGGCVKGLTKMFFPFCATE